MILGHPAFSMKKRNLESIFPKGLIDAIARGEAVLVVGAGASVGCGLPTWSELLHSMVEECERHVAGFVDGDELHRLLEERKFLEVADACTKLLPKSVYRDFIQSKFNVPVAKPQLLHRALFRLGFSGAITTNFDTVLEREFARYSQGNPLPVYTHKNVAELAQQISTKDFFVLKAHGHIDDIESIILARRDYHLIIHANPAFRSSFLSTLNSKSLVFIGYSLGDPDLNLLLSEQVSIFKGFGRQHYAFLPDSGRVMASNLAENYNISAIGYDSQNKHAELVKLLGFLTKEVEIARERFNLEELEIRSAKIPAMKKVREVMEYERRTCEYLGTLIEPERAQFLQMHAEQGGFSRTDLTLIETSISAGESHGREVADLQRKLRFAQHLEALGTLAGGISHDFKNLLTMILGGIGLAEEELPPEHPSRRGIEMAQHAALRGAELCEQVLSFSKGGGDTQRSFLNLSDLLDEAVAFLRSTTSDRIEIKWNPLPSCPQISANSAHLRQVILNLSVNAVQAIGDRDGEISFQLSRASDASVKIQDSVELNGDAFLLLTVEDNGCGMDEQIVSRIFEPFFTTKAKGTGLGLSVVYGIVRAHGGHISVKSGRGKGTRFSILFPIPATLSSEKRQTGRSEKSGNGQTVLLIDDEPMLIEVFQSFIESYGYKVLAFSNGQSAVEAIKSGCACDMVISDYLMPRLNGLDTAKLIKKERPGVPIVLLTGYRVDPVAVKKAGVIRIVGKPLAGPALKTLLSEVLTPVG